MRMLIFFAAWLLLSAGLQAQSSAEAWQQDIALLKQELPKRHPNFFLRYPQATFEADLAKLSANLRGKSDIQIALELQTIVSKAQDAQTRFDLAPLLQQGKVIPIGLGWYAEGLFVSATVQKFGVALGKRVLEINGQKTEAVLEKLGRFFARENIEAVRKEGPQWLRFPEALRMAGVSKDDTLSLLLVDEKGQRYFTKAFPIDFHKDKTGLQPAQYVPKNPDLRWNPLKEIYSLKWLEESQVAYVQYNACYGREMALAAGDSAMAMQLPPFQPLADSLLRLLDARPGAKLFLDLRFNSTGNNPADGIALAERLAAMPFVNLPNRLFVALNRYTTVHAVEIAANFKAKTNATFIGEAPANRPNHFSSPGNLMLPNSRLLLSYGTRQVKALPGDPAVLPLDVPLDLPFAAFRDGKDPLLDYVRKL